MRNEAHAALAGDHRVIGRAADLARAALPVRAETAAISRGFFHRSNRVRLAPELPARPADQWLHRIPRSPNGLVERWATPRLADLRAARVLLRHARFLYLLVSSPAACFVVV